MADGQSIEHNIEVRALNGDLLCSLSSEKPLSENTESQLQQAIQEVICLPVECFKTLVTSFVTVIFKTDSDWEGIFRKACVSGEDVSAKHLAKAVGGVFWAVNFNPLHFATYHRRTNIVKALLDEGSDVNAVTTGEQSTALMISARVGDLATLQLLLSARADVHAETADGDRALHFAACRKKPGFAELLLQFDADVNATNSLGETALENAARLGSEGVLTVIAAHSRHRR